MAKTDAARDNPTGADPGRAGDPLLAARAQADGGGTEDSDSAISDDLATPAATATGNEPTESSRSAMFSVLVVVMASAPTYVALRAIRASRSADFPFGDSLGNAAVVLFAVFAIALLSVCFWPSMSTATWGAPTTGTMLGASGVVMACIGSTHAVAGIIGTGFLSEPAWLGWIVLIGVYPLAGRIASYLAADYVGAEGNTKKRTKPPAKKRPARPGSGTDEELDVDVTGESNNDSGAPQSSGGYVRERSFGSEGPQDGDAGATVEVAPPAPPVDDSEVSNEYDPTWNDEPTRTSEPSDARYSEPAESRREELEARPAVAAKRIVAPASEYNTAEAYETDGNYDDDPFADGDDASGGDWDDDEEWDDDDSEDWDDDPFAGYDD